MDAELLALCNQVVTRYAFLSYDDHNDFTWSATGTTFNARIEFKNELIRDKDGQEACTVAQLYCNGDITLDTRDKLTFVGMPTYSQYPEILKIEKEPDEDGSIYYICVYF